MDGRITTNTSGTFSTSSGRAFIELPFIALMCWLMANAHFSAINYAFFIFCRSFAKLKIAGGKFTPVVRELRRIFVC